MDRQRHSAEIDVSAWPTGRCESGSDRHDEEPEPSGISRREFAKRAGAGSAALAGMVWAAPKISTIRYATKAAAGSRPPTTPSTGAVPIGPLGAKMTLSADSPCVGHSMRVTGVGFAASVGVAIQIDSAAIPIGMTTSSPSGAIDVVVVIPTTAPTGAHNLLAVGPRSGGGPLTLVAPITIKSVAECNAQPAGASGDPVTQAGAEAPAVGSAKGSLPLTGTDTIDLVIMGGAAVIGGRALYGAGKRGRGDLDATKKNATKKPPRQ